AEGELRRPGYLAAVVDRRVAEAAVGTTAGGRRLVLAGDDGIGSVGVELQDAPATVQGAMVDCHVLAGGVGDGRAVEAQVKDARLGRWVASERDHLDAGAGGQDGKREGGRGEQNPRDLHYGGLLEP